MNAEVNLEDVSLIYPVYGINARSFKSSVVRFATGGRLNKDHAVVHVEALKNINLRLSRGDRVGIVGHNGAGKTTLLKVLARIYEPTSGTVSISGKTQCLFDIMIGMDQMLTGYENVFLRGLTLGFSKREIEEVLPQIEEFAELGEFMNMPLKTYSSGMMVRLAFGLITSVPADILLLDEMVGVGDAQFVQKAKARMTSYIRQSDILVLSSHDNALIKEFCNKVIRMEHGEMTAFYEI